MYGYTLFTSENSTLYLVTAFSNDNGSTSRKYMNKVRHYLFKSQFISSCFTILVLSSVKNHCGKIISLSILFFAENVYCPITKHGHTFHGIFQHLSAQLSGDSCAWSHGRTTVNFQLTDKTVRYQ